MESLNPNNSDSGVHVPVLLDEVLDRLAIRPNVTVMDGTVGAGGHAAAILEKSGPNGLLLGSDRDSEILQIARSKLARYGNRAKLFHSKISNLPSVIQENASGGVDAFLLDLGVSSLQLDQPERGFSFSADGPLDMRMDKSEDCWNAADVVNRLTERELADVIYQYGEERRSRVIARVIVERRKKVPFSRTSDLAELILHTLGKKEKIHPATRTFQALRIAVNSELEEVQSTIPRLLEHLKPGGRGGVISFHSLEDRIVKEAFRAAHQSGAFRLVTKKPIVASENEERENRRSRSAKFRVIERL